ncbi:MAG: peptidoglycan/LPS O-acetylase OafA/YrhL [Paraglaciecola sp.]|jgi:peptidoglycan/LPS O-acetylase OafA/YrhL
MNFRKNINGLRAIAVIAVVLFHFNPSWLSGGFAGVDVFFVISGYLMTKIIFNGIEQENFSLLKFYTARANRIIPALAVLCFTLIVLGWIFLTPWDYKTLGKHISSSMGFLSNFVYWRESGYFDTLSKEKVLLHTWSLSVEWQFYIIYPLVLLVMRKFISIKTLKKLVVIGTVLGFIFCVVATYKWPDAAYYLLPTRAWEMMIGGVAYLYPCHIQENKKRTVEWLGLTMIIGSYLFISEGNHWPGHLALFPVLGVFFIIQANRDDSFITNNIVCQRIGSWSYSIYLWHWPIVVAIYYYSLNDIFIYLGIALSVLLGFISNKYIETIKFRNNFNGLLDYFKSKPLYMVIIIGVLGTVIYKQNGFMERSSPEYQDLVSNVMHSPYRKKCHITEYQDPSLSCEYFGSNITWAILGDSHSVEVAYALAEKLQPHGVGLKHFSFSSCKPSWQENQRYHKCSKWYNEAVNYLLTNKKINNIVINHRFTKEWNGGDTNNSEGKLSNRVTEMAKNLDKVIIELSATKDNVYVFYPIPELQRNINQLIGKSGKDLVNILGADVSWYEKANEYIINHFQSATYPINVHLIKPKEVFCDNKNCFAVRDGLPLYFDDHHPSVAGAKKLVELIKLY